MMLSSSPGRRPMLLWATLLVLLSVTLLPLLPATPAVAALTDGSLRIEPIAAYNFVVDSNVLSPSTYAPEAGTLGAKVCNDGATTLTDVYVYIGSRSANTPGVYPTRAHPGLQGSYSLTHEGGSAGTNDASRYIPSLGPGQCAMQYWLVSYPRTGPSDGTIVGAAGTTVAVTLGIKPDDDLYLFYDMWASATDGAATRNVDVTRRVTMRNEISAAANKIWPNTTSKVPQEYLDAIATALGWDTLTPSGSTVAYPGETVTTQGIWYDLGNVGFGFDNNGDGVPDQNAWLQPIGDPNSYDPGCFRLVRTYGILIIKLKSGGEQLIPFVDQLYFESIPENTGVVGLVYYQYAALDGSCTAGLSPYQEVASGYDNEKFSGDYGFGIPPLQSRTPAFTMTKSVNPTGTIPATINGTTLTYGISFQNTGPVAIGDPSLGIPLVISDAIPAGTTYVANSATAVGATVSPGVQVARIRYSTDSGATWTNTQPAAASVTNVQWWLSAPLPAGASGAVSFQVTAPRVANIATIPNTATASFGTAPPFAESTVRTPVAGNNSIAGTVYQDTGTGTGEFANDTLNAGETGRFANVPVTLILRTSSGDITWGTTTTNAAGAFSFTGLPDGDYEVVVDKLSTAITGGWTITGADNRTALALGATADESRTGINFGFAPPLDLTKTRTSASPAYEGDLVTFNLAVANRLPGDGTASLKPCVYEVWAGAESAWTSGLQLNKRFTNPANVTGTPDDVYTVSTFANAQDFISGSNFNVTGQGNITSVEVQLPLYTTGTIGDESALIEFFYEATPGTVGINTPAASSLAIASATLNARNGVANKGTLTWNITALRAWSFADFANAVHLRFSSIKTGSANSSINLDSIGLKITTDALCGTVSADTTLDPVPLTDTYDADLLQFVSASLQPTTNTTTGTAPNTNGTLTWSNVGPIYPGGTRNVVVTFRALQPAPNPVTTQNDAAVTGAKLVNGRSANDDTSFATVQIQGTGSISGRIWSNQDNDWVGTVGYETGEAGIPSVTVRLFACQVGGSNFPSTGSLPLTGTQQNRTCTAAQIGGTWVQVGTQSTSAAGDYSFTGLRPGFYYVDIDTATIPGGVANNAERDTAGSDQNGAGRGGAAVGNSTWGSTANTLTDGSGNAVLFNFLSSDEDIPNVSFGYPTAPVVYGNIWQDYNANTTKDTVDAGIGSVTVTLRDCGADNICGNVGDVLTTTTTDSSGNYRFTGLTVGRTYQVSVNTGTLPAGSTWTQTAESDGTPLNNTITIATIAAGAVSGSHDFGFTRSGAFSIGDTLYYDWDGDAAQDANEEGIRNVTVYLYEDINNDQTIDSRDALVATTTTNQSGVYTFANRANGNYYVVVDRSDPDLPSAYIQTQDPDETGRCVTCNSRGRAVVSGANITTQDFGYLPEGTYDIGDTVWYDGNGDGVQNAGSAQEVGLANVTVNLRVDFNGDGTFVTVRSTVTDASGKYLFADLPSGSYQVVVDTADTDIPNDAFGNNYAATTPTTRTITLTNADNLTADFGFTALAAIGDTVYYDTNNNGQQDYSEPGVAGVTVSLTNVDPFTAPDGTFYAAGAFSRTTTTGASGKYLFSGLPAVPSTGSGVRYTVTVTTASGLLAGRPQTADPDRDGETCTDEDPITLAAVPCNSATTQRLFPGSNFMGADFGYLPTGILGDTLWIDANGNGARDAGEYGIPYVTVNQRYCGPNNTCGDGDDVLATTETDANGEYLFTGLANGIYQISLNTADPDLTRFTAPSVGLVASYEPNGTINNLITVTMAGGVVTQIDGQASPSLGTPGVATPCTAGGSCSLVADFGYRFFDAVAGLTVSGTVCQDTTPGSDGLCDADANGVGAGEAPFGGETVWLYRWSDDGDGVLESGEAVLAASTTTATEVDPVTGAQPGDYRFANLPAATGNNRYIVSLAAPTANLTLTTTGAPPALVSTNANGANVSAYRSFNLSANLTNQDFAYISQITYDFGDLPDSYSTTLQGSPDGARHSVSGAPTLYLGATAPDTEANGVPTSTALGDGADEDGVAVPTARWVAGVGGGSVNVTVNGGGYLVGWIDFNQDGDFADANEMVIDRSVSAGTANYAFAVPAGIFTGVGSNVTLSARFRLFSSAPTISKLAYSGTASSGEVEDYRFVFTPNAVTLTSFGAEADAGGPVTLRWRTSAELGVAGFHILRSDSGGRAGAERITPELIEAVGDSVSGAAYTWVDKRPAQEGTRYWLEVVNIDGTPEEYGPVAAAPQVGGEPTTRLFLPLLGR